MKVSVIIPAFNEAKHVSEAVGSAREAAAGVVRDRPSVRWRVIVVDNNSTDATADLARAAGADAVVFEPVNHIARARNAGAWAALRGVEGPAENHWLIFLDADSRMDGGLLSDVLDAADSGRVIGGSSAVHFEPRNGVVRWLEPVLNGILCALKLTAGAFIFCRADAFEAIGGFDQTLFAAEDAKIGQDLRRWGKPRGLGLAVMSRHRVVTSARKFELYRPHDFGTLCLRALFTPATLRDKRRLGIFYDGRR
jgi:glycosyltransferase involved in cell wall biosynthesis